jgi:hypothetical protein
MLVLGKAAIMSGSTTITLVLQFGGDLEAPLVGLE